MILEPSIVPLAFFCSGKKIEAVVTALDWMTGLRTDPLVDLRMPISKTEPTGSIMVTDRKSTRLNSSHVVISYAVFCLKKKKTKTY